MTVLVTGGAGYIGSHTIVELLDKGYNAIIADDMSNSNESVLSRITQITGKQVPFYKINVCDEDALSDLFEKHPEIDAVIHFAGFKAVGESVEKPLMYYQNNVGSALAVLKVMQKYGVKNFVFSSSATVYGDPETVPVTEETLLAPPASPYAYTKLMIEQIAQDVYKADTSMNIAIFRYFNPIGAHPSGLIGEDPSGIPNNLTPYIAKVAVGKLPKLNVFGNDYPTKDGTCVRDYIHVVDLASGHVNVLSKLAENCGLVIYNLGTGIGYSVMDVLRAYNRVCGRELPYEVIERRAGDVPEYYADASRAEKEMGWKAVYTLEDMCAHSWNWQKNNPNGYKDA